MKKYLSKILFLIIGIMVITHLSVNADLKRVVDNSNLFTDEEVSSIEEKVNVLISQTNMDILILTTDNKNGDSSEEYAREYYDNNDYGLDDEKSGIVLLIDMEDRYVYIDTSGTAIKYFNDDRINNIIDGIYEKLSDGNYYEGVNLFLNDVSKYIAAGIPSNQYEYDVDKAERQNTTSSIAFAVLIGVIVATVTCLGVSYSYSHPKSQNASVYIKENSLNFISRRDQFITTNTTRRRIEKNNNGSGGSNPGRSTTHKSSSGRSHGGGGRHF